MSRCFGSAADYKPTRHIEGKPAVDLYVSKCDCMSEEFRQRMENWDGEFVTPEQYVRLKLRMLRKDMYIEPSNKDIAHLRSLKSKAAIDAAVHSIIDRAWSDE